MNTTTALKYRSRQNAERVAFDGKGLAVVMGDDSRYWVVSLADAQRLSRQGFEVSYLPR
jgi:hypothetical protein